MPIVKRTMHIPKTTPILHARANLPEADPKTKGSEPFAPAFSWPVWILVIAVASGPWFGIVPHPQWDRVLHGSRSRLRGQAEGRARQPAAVPFGWSFAKSRHGRGGRSPPSPRRPSCGSRSISAAVFRLRDPSATDWVMAPCGSAVGSFASQAFLSARRGQHAARARRTRGLPRRAVGRPWRQWRPRPSCASRRAPR